MNDTILVRSDAGGGTGSCNIDDGMEVTVEAIVEAEVEDNIS